MRTIGCITTPGRGSAVCVANVLAAKHARVISINKYAFTNVLTGSSLGPCVTPGVEYEIWFEHECAIEDSWRESVTVQASEQWREQQKNASAGMSKSG